MDIQETLKTLNNLRLEALRERIERMNNGDCEEEKNECKTDCYFYHVEKDMGANIELCCYNDERWRKRICPCKDCTNYISNSEVSKIIRGIVKERNV